MARQLDRRVQRTRKMLRESLMSLILEETYDEISIQNITDKANLGRATFYLHFKDKDELLLEVMDQLMEDILEQVPELSEVQWQLEDTKAIVKLFDFAAEHYDLYRILIISSGGITASRQLRKTIATRIVASIQGEIDRLGTNPRLPADFIANHLTGSLLSTIYWWLDNDLPYTAEEMAAMFQKMNQLDRVHVLGIDRLNGSSEAKEERGRRKKRGKEKESPTAPKTEAEIEPGESEPGPEVADQEDKT